MTHHLDLDSIVLKHGKHGKPEQGACLMEVVSMFADEPFSDHPKCVSPVLGAFGRAWNDGMRSDEEREQLKRYIPMLVGTAGDNEADERRAWMATDWLVRVHTPAWLRLAGLTEQAERLENLAELKSRDNPHGVLPTLDAIRKDADAARAAAATGAATGAAAWDAAATEDAAGDAAWDAAAARDAAWAAVAARAAAWAAVVAGAAAAAGDALQPTVEHLQKSAHDLFERMIKVGQEAAV